MPEIARVNFLEERDSQPDLAAEQHVPEHHRAQKDAARLGEEIRLVHQERLDEAPQDHLDDRPIAEIEKARPGAGDQIPVPQHDCADAPRRAGIDQAHGASLWRAPCRATSRNTSSSVLRPYFSISALGAPESTMRPPFIIST